MAAEAKTKPTDMSVEAFLGAVEPGQRHDDARTIADLLARITGDEPRMWGPTMVGYGQYHYRYDSGREGVMFRLGFSPRKPELVLYVLTGADGEADLLARLGKHKTGRACLYIRRLADIDMDVLEQLIRNAKTWMDSRYPR